MNNQIDTTFELTVPHSKKSGAFTKKYNGKQKYRALKERVNYWIEKHGQQKTLRIMLEQGIISKKQYEENAI